MSQNNNNSKSIEEFINALVISFITTTILFVGKNVIYRLNAKIEAQNEEIKMLKAVVDANNDKHRFHLLEIVAENKTFRDDFGDKYNTDMLAVNANIESQIDMVRKHQDITIEKMFNRQNKEISEFLDNIEELNLQMSGVHFNISSIMGRQDEDNTSVNNELFVIRSKIKELESEMPVCIGSDLRNCVEIFANPKIRNSILGSNYLSNLNIECFKRLPLVKYIDMNGFNRVTINGVHKFMDELSIEDKGYIKRLCDEYGIKLQNTTF
jgi:hypothetical protein